MTRMLSEKPNAEGLLEEHGAGLFLNGRYLPPPPDEDGKLWVRTSAVIQAEAKDLYEIWHNVEAAPIWQERITSVKRTGPKTSHWTMAVGDRMIEWDAEVLAEQPGKRIAWRSTGGDLEQAGEVVFEAAPGDRGTIVVVLQEFKISKLSSAWQTLTERNPKQAVIENLRHFKAFAETGEIPRTEGQPHGPRGTVGGLKKSAYGETIAAPPGANRTEANKNAD